MILSRARGLTLIACALCLATMLSTACDDDDGLKPDTTGNAALTLNATVPESLITGIQQVYNDRLHGAAERLAFYQDLFPPADDDSLSFIFRFQPIDVDPGEEPTWGLDAERQAHENMFQAQENHQIYSLELGIQFLEPEPLQFPSPGQEDWVMIYATGVYLRLMFNPQDGLLIDGGQAEFLLAPADGRWYVTDWTDLPRPFAAGEARAVEPMTWGALKSLYR